MADQTEFDGFVDELRALVGQDVQRSYRWYSTHSKVPMFYFRFSGLCVVIGSILLPVITEAKDFPYRNALLTAVSLSVAILSSLSTFYRWDSTWRSRKKAAQELQGLLANWELAL